MADRIPQAVVTGKLVIDGIVIPCAVLDDERRVLTQEGFLHVIGRAGKIKGGQSIAGDGTPPFLSAQNLQPFIDADLVRATAPIIFRPLKAQGAVQIAYGFQAEVLPAVCKVFLKARDAKALTKSQEHIAHQADILIRAFATVGIVALVDEATGYQYTRRRNALNLILEAYIRKELMPWTKCFPDEFYQEMFRVWGWDYNADFSSRRPGFAGVLTRKLVYEKLPPGVLEELQRLNPTDGHGRRKHKHHQYLTDEIGHPHLQQHVTKVIVVLQLSDSQTDFFAKFAKVFPTVGTQIYLDLASIELEAASVTDETNPDPEKLQESKEPTEKEEMKGRKRKK